MGKDVDGRDPVVLFIGGDMKRWDECFHIFDIEGCFCRDAILGEELVQGSSQKLAID